MNESDYLFEDAIKNYYLTVFFGVLMISTGLFLFYKIYQKKPYFGSGEHKQDKLPFAVILLIFGIVLLSLAPNGLAISKRIKNNRAETYGITIIGDHPTKNGAVNYRFTVDHRIYRNTCAYPKVELGKYPIKVPGGHYKVIYNSLYPRESVIDFNIEK
jgi:hypothetical protein